MVGECLRIKHPPRAWQWEERPWWSGSFTRARRNCPTRRRGREHVGATPMVAVHLSPGFVRLARASRRTRGGGNASPGGAFLSLGASRERVGPAPGLVDASPPSACRVGRSVTASESSVSASESLLSASACWVNGSRGSLNECCASPTGSPVTLTWSRRMADASERTMGGFQRRIRASRPSLPAGNTTLSGLRRSRSGSDWTLTYTKALRRCAKVSPNVELVTRARGFVSNRGGKAASSLLNGDLFPL